MIEDCVQDIPSYFQFVADGLDLCLIDSDDGCPAFEILPAEMRLLIDSPPQDVEVWTKRSYCDEEVEICMAARLLESRQFGDCHVAVYSLEVAP